MDISSTDLERIMKNKNRAGVTSMVPQLSSHHTPRINFDAVASLVSGDGRVELPVEQFLKLLQMDTQTITEPPQPYFISKASYTGTARENCINLKCSFEVAVLVNSWVQIKLLPDGIGLSSHSIKSTSKSSSNKNNAESSVSTQQARIGVMGDGYHLVTSVKDEYLVEMDVLVPYHSARKTGMMIWVPRAAENVISFTVNVRDIQIKVDPSFVGEEHNNIEGKLDETSISVLFPPTNLLSVNWTVKIDEGPSNTKDEQKLQKMMITAEHNMMCSIGEGIVMLTSNFNYTIVHGSVGTFEIAIPDDLHVLGVEGNGIKKWEVVGGKDKTALIVLDTKYSQRCLRVMLDYGLENSYHMTVISELSMGGTSADVTIPSFKCVGEEINREKGFLAIEARTNVEIAEIRRAQLALVDTSELPQTLWQLASNPILMGYKFLGSGYNLSLRVKKHDDVGVLIAACDEAHYTTTCSEEGKILHKLVMRIRNSQKQYVRIKLPTDNELWSASVAGVPVKPAMDESGMVMIQLHKTSSRNANNPNNVFVVELVYIEIQDKPMEQSGSIDIGLAVLDIPINYLFVSLWLPTNYEYEDFTGGLKEVSRFSRVPPNSVTAPTDDSRIADMYSQTQMMSNVAQSFRQNAAPVKRRAWGGGGGGVMGNLGQIEGVLPVRVEMPVSGQEFKFEQLIVMGSNATLHTTYQKRKVKSYGQRRSSHWWNCCS